MNTNLLLQSGQENLFVVIHPVCFVNSFWTTPPCASVHCCNTPALQNILRKWVVPITFIFFHRSLPNFVCMETIYNSLYIIKKTVLLWKQAIHHLWKDFDYINLTVKLRYWPCSDAQCNQKNLVAVLKEFTESSRDVKWPYVVDRTVNYNSSLSSHHHHLAISHKGH